MQESHPDEVVEGSCVAPRLFPFLGHHLGPLLGITLRHFFLDDGFELEFGFEGAEEDEGWAIVRDCRVKKQGCEPGLFITTVPPLPLPASWGNGPILRQARRFGFQ